jgi:hypothetical protein
MKAKFVSNILNESNLVSKFRKGMKVTAGDTTYYIEKVEEHSPKFDILHVYDTKRNKRKMISSEGLEQTGTIIPTERQKRQSQPKLLSMTTREYIKELKGAIDGLKQTSDDFEDPGSFIYDSAESMIYDESLYNYLYKKYKKEYGQEPHYKRDLIELLSNDMSNLYWQ